MVFAYFPALISLEYKFLEGPFTGKPPKMHKI